MSVVENSKIDRILAVDDTRDNLILVQTILESEGYEIDLVSDGISALQKVEQSPPDLILLDVMMPGMDGYEVTRRIRNNPAINYIPILLITAFHESSVVEGLDAGADDFIRKPFDTDELLARVRSLLRLKHSLDEQRKMARQREDFVSRLTPRLTHSLSRRRSDVGLVSTRSLLQNFARNETGDFRNDTQQSKLNANG